MNSYRKQQFWAFFRILLEKMEAVRSGGETHHFLAVADRYFILVTVLTNILKELTYWNTPFWGKVWVQKKIIGRVR